MMKILQPYKKAACDEVALGVHIYKISQIAWGQIQVVGKNSCSLLLMT